MTSPSTVWNEECDIIFESLAANSSSNYHPLKVHDTNEDVSYNFDINDEWMMTTLPSYDSCFMFEFDLPICYFEFCEDVALSSEQYPTYIATGSHRNDRKQNEIQILMFDGWRKLGSSRDISVVAGGFVNHPLKCLRFIHGTNASLLASSGNSDGSIDLWRHAFDCQKNDDECSTLLNKVTTIPCKLSNPKIPLISSSSVRKYELTAVYDVTTCSTINMETYDHQLHVLSLSIDNDVSLQSLISIAQVDSDVFTVGNLGTIRRFDLRMKASINELPLFTFADVSFCSFDMARDGLTAVMLTSKSSLIRVDCRMPNLILSQCQLLSSEKFDCIRFSSVMDDELNSSDMVSLSGSNVVSIYNLPSYSTPDTISPLFTHRGHHSSIVTHKWHPSIAGCAASIDRDSWLHLWKPSLNKNNGNAI